MTLTRRDIAETSIRTIAAFVTTVAIVAAVIGFFIDMATDLRAQQKEVQGVKADVRQLNTDVRKLTVFASGLQQDLKTLAEGQKKILMIIGDDQAAAPGALIRGIELTPQQIEQLQKALDEAKKKQTENGDSSSR